MKQGLLDLIFNFLRDNVGLKTAIDTSIFSDSFWQIIISWIVLFLVLLGLVILFFSCSKSTRLFDWLSNHLAFMSVLVWIFGVCIYVVGFYDVGVNGLAVVPRAVISSFKMFVVSNDLARVYGHLRNHTIYMALFSIVHFSAAFISFLFIFKLISHKIKTSIKLFSYRLFKSKDRNIHLFWGVNEASCLLAESIFQERKLFGDVLILVDIDEDSDDNLKKKASLSSITNTVTIKNSEIARLEDIDAFVLHCYGGPSCIISDDNDDILAKLNLRQLKRIIRKSNKLCCYFLSSDENKNIAGALNLQHDSTLKQVSSSKALDPLNKPVIYVHAGRTANNEVFNNYSQFSDETSRIEIKMIDSAYLSVIELKCDDNTMPVQCVDLDESTATVNGSFTSMVVGFGETGQEAFKFLYEFSAFIDKNKNKIPFTCYAFDEKMDDISGTVLSKMPAITKDELCMIQANVNSEVFWDKVSCIITELNYVVIAMNDDDAGLALAVDLFKFALQRRDMKQPLLKIMLRCYNNSNYMRMDNVVKNLNSSVVGINIQLGLFGLQKKMYKFDNILSDRMLHEAKEFHKTYSKSGENAEILWKSDFGNEKINEIANKYRIPRYYAICDLNRQIEQNISNSLHIKTKMFLLGLDTKAYSPKLELYFGYQKGRKPNTLEYECPQQDLELLHNVAIVEHERWIASHKLLGYSYDKQRNLVSKHHECMIPWCKLGDETKMSYDCDSVDTSIRMVYDIFCNI